jgi:hypothetical protein
MVAAPCNLVDTDRRFREADCLHHQDAETMSSSETSVSIYRLNCATSLKTNIFIVIAVITSDLTF